MAKAGTKKTAAKAPAKAKAGTGAKSAALRPEFSSERFAAGLAVRKEVLGSAYVDASLARADDFTAELQKLVTETAWCDIWSRPGLARRDRSLLNLGMLTALNRPHELKLHLRGALNNGITRDEIKEILLQTLVYCGAPAALDAFRVAGEVFKEFDAA
jgi:4-carboxymuconolactone decarboxylase